MINKIDNFNTNAHHNFSIILFIFDRFGYAVSTVKCALQSSPNCKIIYPKRHSHVINVLTHFKKVYNNLYVNSILFILINILDTY